MSRSKQFLKAEKLIQQYPLADDILEQLDDLYDVLPEREKDDFLWFYEHAELEVNFIEQETNNAKR